MLKSLFSCNYDYFEKRASPQSSTGSAFFTRKTRQPAKLNRLSFLHGRRIILVVFQLFYQLARD
jgi:hypothetical protein